MRIYIPMTARMMDEPSMSAEATFAVTAGLVKALDPSYGQDEHEEVARELAADMSLAMCLSEGGPLRRIVVAADTKAHLMEIAPGQVEAAEEIDWSDAVSIHIDDEDACRRWEELAANQLGANPSSEDIDQWIDSIEEFFDMDWYDVSEREVVCQLLRTAPSSS